MYYSLTKYWGSAWWTTYFPITCGIKIDHMKYLESAESSAPGDSNKDSMEGSVLGELWRPEAPHGATGQDPHLQGVDEAPDSWEQHQSTCSLSSQNLEGLTVKFGTLGLRAARKNRYGAAKKRVRRAMVAGSLDGDSVVGQSWPAQSGQNCRSPVHLGTRVQIMCM